ncbi:GntR family transcriptional regulator [Ktedonosporobacter rubrisoli]|uniref:GntR family transcriptional regulator n=1 Tax=Ktedonosporobacter rubrisoli TaxID=2509675 RepID=A0A4P6JWW9_KTERU|nr:GntR family transcriptional regulator [Ktedonosporobacter rubrisoli]QBD80228.1 GntR family transcriptional regulator [Ktedonosporobacter rubrisoli]
MAIWLHIDMHNGIPIYVQLIQQIKHAIEVGRLMPGDSLPTVRELANELAIAPNTIVKAYNELQRTGLIESRPGRGTTVVGQIEETLRIQKRKALIERLHTLVLDANSLDMSTQELRTHFEHAVQQFMSELPKRKEKS